MTFSAQQCLDSARKCEQMASQSKDLDARATFIECAHQWLEQARLREELERHRLKLL
jgi:hypothetical protein